MDSDVQVAGEGDRIGVDHVAPVEELSRPPSSKSVSFTDVQRALSSREGQRTSSSQFAEPAEWREKKEPIGKKDTVLSRRSAGSTPFNERLEHRSQDYSRTVEHYRSLPSVTDYPYQARNPALVKPNPLVFLELECAETGLGKLTFELFADSVPRTVENFIRLCEGDPQKGELSYKLCRFHRIIPGFMMVGGDIVSGDGSAGMSIYGPTFPDESFELQHVGPGILTMVNNGPDTNNSQFAILLDRAEWLDGRSVVFGKLVVGYDLLHKTANKYGSKNGNPTAELFIGSCGVDPGQRL